MMHPMLIACLVLSTALVTPAMTQAGPTLDLVRANGKIRCGVGEGLPGFTRKDEAGRWQGFGADFCRAVAAAALGQADQVDFVPATSANRFPLLLSGKIELLLRTTTYTFEREAALGVQFAGILYYDGLHGAAKERHTPPGRFERGHHLSGEKDHP